MLFRGDTLIATAMDANPDLIAKVGAHCFARVIQPTPQEVAVLSAPVQRQEERRVVDPPPSWKPIEVVQQCRIGIPCGNACIPMGRVCHVGQLARVGQECGKGYIALAKTCHVDRPQPPPITPVMALPVETRTPTLENPTAIYGRPDDAPRNILPQPSIDVGGGSTASPQFHTAAPAPQAQAPSPPKTVHVEGYDRSNGTHVQSYDRAASGQGLGRSSRR
jgi:hypothetical protein